MHFPKIEQFRQVVREVKHRAQFVGLDTDGQPIMDRDAELPVLTYRGTVKLHGTNAGVRVSPDGVLKPMSRSRLISPTDDNHGFAKWATYDAAKSFRDIVRDIADSHDLEWTIENPITIYGEWCGQGVQSGVAIAHLPKMFVAFAVRHGDDWLPDSALSHVKHEALRIYNTLSFASFDVMIDFNDPALAATQMEMITQAIDQTCPVGEQLGIHGPGEGVVWRPVAAFHPEWNHSRFWFKTKGEKHAESRRERRTRIEIEPEKLESIAEFIDSVVTDARLEKGIDKLVELGLPFDRKSTGEFLKWVIPDLLSEEADVIDASGLDRKELTKPLNEAARKWFFARLDRDL